MILAITDHRKPLTKVHSFRDYIEAGRHKRGLIGFKSFQEIAADCSISASTVSTLMWHYFPGTARMMKKHHASR